MLEWLSHILWNFELARGWKTNTFFVASLFFQTICQNYAPLRKFWVTQIQWQNTVNWIIQKPAGGALLCSLHYSLKETKSFEEFFLLFFSHPFLFFLQLFVRKYLESCNLIMKICQTEKWSIKEILEGKILIFIWCIQHSGEDKKVA